MALTPQQIKQLDEAQKRVLAGKGTATDRRNIEYAQKTYNYVPATTTPTPATNPVMSYDDWLKSAGSPYANAYSDETLNAYYDPYYNKQLGAEDYQRGLATQQLGVNLADTTKYQGESASDAGLFGSGVYKQELNRSLEDLQKGYQQQWGTGEYTPYSQRKFQIEQDRRLAKEQGRLGRQGQAWDAYSQQYAPLMYNQ